jgi:hypothetical protein
VTEPILRRTCFDVMRDILMELAPEEVKYLPDAWEVHLRSRGRRTRERLLGSGAPMELATWTLQILSTTGLLMLQAAQDAARDNVRSRAGRVFGWLRTHLSGSRRPEPQAPIVRPSERVALMEDIRLRAVSLNIAPERIDAIIQATERAWFGDPDSHQ